MKNKIYYFGLTIISLFFYRVAISQMADYQLTSGAGTYIANSGSATAVNSVEGNDVYSSGIPIGFVFKFDTTNYSFVKVGSNGWMSFDTTVTPSGLYNRTNSLSLNPGVRPLVAPLWDNLDGSTGTASYELTGTSPNQVFTFEWKEWKWDLNATSAVISFQVKLYETSNKIEFVYKQEAGALVSNSSGASIGLGAKNTGSGNFVSLSNSGTSPTVSTTVETNSIAAKPATGQVYSFEKSSCSAPIGISAINVGKTKADIVFVQPTHLGDSFYIEYGPVGFTRGSGAWAIDTIKASGVQYSLTGLTAGTVYNYYVGTICQTGVDSIENTEGERFVTTVNAPYFTSFDTITVGQTKGILPNGWGLSVSTGPQWTGDTATGSDQKTMATGPHYDHTNFNSTGGGFVYLESSSGLLAVRDSIQSPWMDISLLNTPYIDFYYHMYGANIGELITAAVDSAGTVFLLDTITGQQHTSGTMAWTKRTVSLVPAKGSTKLKIVFIGKKNGDKSDMAIDDVSVYDKAIWDFKLEAILSPKGVCSDSSAEVKVAIKNNSVNSIDFSDDSVLVRVTVSGSVNAVYTKTIKTDTLAGLDTLHVTLKSNYNKSSIGTHTFLGKVEIVNDPTPANDTLSLVLQIDTATNATLPSMANKCTNSNSVSILGVGSPVGGTSVYSGNGVSGNSFNPGTAGSGTHSVKFVYTDSHGCKDSTTSNVVVNSAPNITISSLPTLCKGGPSVTLTQGSPTGGTYSGNNVIASKYNPINYGGDSIQYLFVDGNSCRDSSKAFLKVDSVASVSFPSLSNRCLSAGSLTLNSAIPAGGTYSGTQVSSGIYTPTSAGVDTIKYVLVGTGVCKDSASQTITINANPTVTFASISAVCVGTNSFTLTGGSPSGGSYSGNRVTSGSYNPSVVGTDTITYSFTDGNSCTAIAKSFAVVNALPTVTFSALSSVCEGSASFALSGGSPSGGTYSGNNVSSGSYHPSTVGSDTLKYSYTNSNSCTDFATSVITVNSKPTVSFPSLSSRCLNAGSLTLNTATPSGGTYSGNNVSGGVYIPLSAGLDTIVYSFINSNSCSDSASQTIQIDSVPNVTFAALSNLCEGSNAIALSGGMPTGGVYSGNNVSSNSYNPVSSGLDTLKYEFTDLNSCSDSATSVITVDTTPNVNLGTFSSICKGTKALSLTGGTPSGGTYFGKNVALTLFIPFASGVDSIHYAYKDANNCADTATQSIVVDTLPVVSLTGFSNVCENTPAFILTGGSPSSGVYSGNNVGTGMYTATTAGVDTITYSFTDLNSCTGTSISLIQVDSVSAVSLNLSFSRACENSNKLTLSGGMPIGGTYKGLNVSGVDFDPSLGTPGITSVTYSFTNTNNCSDSAISTVVIDSIITASVNSFGAICRLSDPMVLTAGSPSGGVYSGTNVNSATSEFDPSSAILGANTISYTTTSTQNCKDSVQGNITVEQNPSFSLGNDTSICGSATLTLDIGIPFMKYDWSTGDTIQSIKIQKSAIVIAQVTDTSTMANCAFSDTVRVDYDEICVGLDEVFSDASIKYYPNPSNGKFYLVMENIDINDLYIQIVSMTGQEIYSADLEVENGKYEGLVQLDEVPSGIYFMNLISEKGIISKRISIR